MNLEGGDVLRNLRGDMRLTAQRIELLAKAGGGDRAAATPRRSKIPHSTGKSTKQRPTGRKPKPMIKRPVGYTWNRGGRLKEIRIRTRARKFVNIWKAKTFGRILPSVADSFYKKRIVKTALAEWKTVWWEARVEWKLLVRAEYHYKYSLYSLVWLQWRSFTKRKRNSNAKNSKAVLHYSKKHLKLHLSKWALYVRVRRAKKSMYNNAHKVFNENLAKRTWKTWKTRFQQVKQERADNETAILHWVGGTQRKTWRKWSGVLERKNMLKKQNIQAEKHCDNALLRRCVYGWLCHKNDQRKKYDTYKFAACIRNRTLAGIALKIWHSRWKRVLELREQEHVIERISLRFTLRRFLLTWNFFLELRRKQHENEKMADVHHRRSCLRKTLHHLTQQASLGRKKVHMQHQAILQRRLFVLRNSWTIWQSRLKQVEDSQMSGLTEIAREHNRVNMLDGAWNQWASYVRWRRVHKSQLVKADSHFIVKVLPVCFKTWRWFVLNARKKRRLVERAEDFRTNSLYAKIFYTWWIHFDQCRENRTLERIAFLHSKEVILKRNFSSWKRKTRARISEERSAALADSCYREILLKRTFASWKLYLNFGRRKRKKIIRAATHYYCSTVSGAWVSWRAFVELRKTKNTITERACNFRYHHLAVRCFNMWKKRYANLKKLQNDADLRFEAKGKELTRHVFNRWKSASESAIVESEKRNRADSMRSRHALLKTLRRWRLWSAMHCHQRVRKEERLSEICGQLNKKKLKRYLRQWKHAAAVSRVEQYKNAVATDHYRLRVCNIALQAWKLYWYTRIKKMVMDEQASRFSDNRLMISCFAKWTSAFDERNEENRKTSEALWHWACTLQSKVVTAWVSYTEERKQKKSRYDEAMQRRRLYLLKKGCRMLLESHAETIRLRMQIGATQKAISSYAGYHLAWKFAKKWRNITIQNRERRLPQICSPPPTTNLTNLIDHPMLLPIPGKVSPVVHHRPTHTKSKPSSHTIQSWVPEPRAQFTSRSPQASTLQPMQHKQLRPAPRGPDFLMDSLQREGLDDVIETSGVAEKHVRFAEELQSGSGDVARGHRVDENLEKYETHGGALYNERQSVFYQSGACVHSTPRLPVTSRPQVPTEEVCLHHPVLQAGPTVAPTESDRSLVLLPPSAFTSNHETQTSSHCPLHPDLKEDSEEEEERASAASSSPCSLDEEASSIEAPSPRPLVVKDPRKHSKPESLPVHVEIMQIKKQLQDYRLRKEDLRALKHQKELLEEWLSREQLRPAADCSIFGPAQDELLQMTEDLKSIAEELRDKRPHIEKLALRVKALSSGPA